MRTNEVRKCPIMADLSPYVLQSREKFQDISSKFAHVAQKHSSNSSEQINQLVEEVIAFVQKAPSGAVIYPDYDIVLDSFGTLVSAQTPQYLTKLCHFICFLVEKHNVTIRDELNERTINMCLQGLRRSNFCDDSAHILKAVEMLIRADRNHLLKRSKILQSLALPVNGILLQIIASTETSGPLLLAAVGCLELLMMPSPSSSNTETLPEYQKVMSEISEPCMNALISVLGKGKPLDLDDMGYYKLVIASMRCLHHLLSPTASVFPPVALATSGRLGELIGIFRAFLALGLPGTSNNIKYPVGPFKAQSSSVALPVPVQTLAESKDEYKGRTTKALRKNRKKTSKKGAEVLVDSLEQEKPDLTPRNNRLGMDALKIESPKLPHWSLTSDSDMSSSDVESGRSGEPEGRSALSRVRQMACSLLLCLVQVTEPSVLFSFWPSLLPDGMPTGPGFILPKPLKYGEEATLTTLILSDPSSKGRALAAIVLASLLTSWQRFLVQAECSRDKKTMSFTPFSVALGWSLCSIHRDMCLAFSSELSPVAILQILRCCTALVLASCYHKLASGHLHRLVAAVRPLLKHRDPTVVGGVLSLFGAIISLDPTPPEVVQIFTRSSSSKLGSDEVADVAGVPSCAAIAYTDCPVDEEDTWDNEFYDDEEDPVKSVVGSVEEPMNSVEHSDPKHCMELMRSRAPAGLPWIMEACLKPLSLKDRSAPISVQTECLQVLFNIAKNQELVPKLFFDSDVWTIVQSRFVLGPGIIIEGGDSFPLKFHWGKFWESLGLAIQKIVEGSSKDSLFTLPQAVTYWQALLSESALVPFIQEMDTPSIRAVGCDVLAAIGSTVFGNLTRDKQILCETLLFGSSRDEEPAVKSAALRALGIYTLYPSLREDLLFLLDTCDTLQSALDGDPSRGEVWSKASWALGNLCDALVRNREEGFSEELPEGSLLELLEACATAAQPLPKSGSNGDRVRFNGVRAAGSVIRLIDFRGWDEMAGSMSLFSLGKRGKEATEKVVMSLVEAATKSSNMKVRWNACYAISSMLKNTSLFSNSGAYADLVTKTKVFPALCSLVRDFCNLKVRINAALALSSPSRHINYGQRNFLEAWKSLLEGLDNTQRSGFDLTGFNHQSNLIDQIILTLCHLAKLVEKADLGQLGEILDPYLENTQAQMSRRSHTLVPEKASVIEEAASYLASMKKSPAGNTVCFTKSEEEGLSKLLKVFSVEESKMYGSAPL